MSEAVVSAPEANIIVLFAHEMGQTSGGACITSTYGGVPDEWRRGEGPHMSWVPKKFTWEDLQTKGWKFEKAAKAERQLRSA
jgi:hypothetical protein